MAKVQQDKIDVKVNLQSEEAQRKIHELTKSTENLRKQNQEHRKEISRLAAAEGDFSAEIKRLNDTIRQNNKEIADNNRQIAQQEKIIDNSHKTAAQLGRELKNLKRELNNTSKSLKPEKYKELENRIKDVEKAYAEATKSTSGFLSSLISVDKMKETIKGFFLGLAMVITTHVIGAFKNLVATIQDFEKANSKLASVLGTTIQGVARLTEQAKFLGRTTTATASEVTHLQTELAKLGFSQDIIEKMTPATLKFAKAVDTDLASAAAFAGAAMRMFNKDASEAESVMATFAVATTNSALDFSKLEASLATVGPVANAFGFSVEETTALLGQLSNAGFDASSAATATRNILLNLADANGDLAQALGGPVTNLNELVKGMRKLNSEGIDLAKALELTDKRSVAAFATFLNGADSLLSLKDSITDCTGAFNTMSDTMVDNAAGSWAGFESAVEGLILKFFDFRESLKTLYEWGTALVNWLGTFIDAFQPMMSVIGYVAKGIGYLVSQLAKLIGTITGWVTQTKVGVVVLNTLVAALTAYRVALLLSSQAVKSFIAGLIAKISAVKLSEISIKSAITATKNWTLALLSNPFTLVAAAIAAVVTGIVAYTSSVGDAKEATDDWTEASREATRQYGEQEGKIRSLIMVAENENISLKRRQQAIEELNRIIPGYNARLDQTTGKYVAAKEKLDLYLNSLKKEMYYKAYEDKLKRLTTAAAEARDEVDSAEIYLNENRYENHWYGKTYNTKAKKAVVEAKKTYKQAEKDLEDFQKRMNKAISDGEIEVPEMAETIADSAAGAADSVIKSLDKVGAKASETVTRIKEIDQELKRLRKIDPQTDEEYERIKRRIADLKAEKKGLTGSGSNKKGKHTPGTYKEDSLDEVTAPIDSAHQQRLLEINKKDISETEKSIEKNKELIRYCSALSVALEELRKNTASTHTQTLDKITAEQDKIAAQSLKAQQEIDKAQVKQAAEYHSKRLEANENFYATQSDLIRASVIADRDIEQAAAIYQMNLERESHDATLKELNRYYDEVAEADYYSSEERKNLLEKIGKDIQNMKSQILTDTGKMSEALREAMTDSTSADAILDGFDRRITVMNLYYEALKESGELSADELVALETEKNRRIAEINYQRLEKEWELQEMVGLSWSDEYNRELDRLDYYHTQGLMKEKAYQRKKLQLGVDNAKKYFDYYAQLSGSMFSAIQDAEIAMSDAKYDVLIQQAKNNGEETTALEEEKENNKLAIQKKYADVNFAIKISQIVADTAVAVMKAYADLGPIAGSIAAALISATGVAQVLQAKAERDKIKNMQPSKTAASSTTASADSGPTQRLLTGFSEGGYTGDGGRYEVAGVVHKGEYVVPKPIMDDPRVVDAVGMIESIRRYRRFSAGSGGGAHDGFAEGGFSSQNDSEVLSELAHVVSDLKEAVKNIRAYVVLKDINRAENSLAMSQAPFSKS